MRVEKGAWPADTAYTGSIQWNEYAAGVSDAFLNYASQARQKNSVQLAVSYICLSSRSRIDRLSLRLSELLDKRGLHILLSVSSV